jgi:hypothetical protein
LLSVYAMTTGPRHHGLFMYDSDDEFVDRVTSFLGPGTEEGEAGMAVLSPGKWTLLREALGDAAVRILYRDRDSVYTRPEATLAYYDAVLRQSMDEGAPAVRLIGELPIGKSETECGTWEIYEAVLNRAFADQPVSILCGYDARECPPAAIEGAWRTHNRVLADAWEGNPRYQEPTHLVGALTPPAQELTGLSELPVDGGTEASRAQLRSELAILRVPKAEAEDLLRAAAEVFDNARTHGHGPRSQRLGRIGGLIVWELTDNGQGFADPLAGYLPPPDKDANASGLWVVRQLTRRLEFLASPRGFTTRLWI